LVDLFKMEVCCDNGNKHPGSIQAGTFGLAEKPADSQQGILLLVVSCRTAKVDTTCWVRN